MIFLAKNLDFYGFDISKFSMFFKDRLTGYQRAYSNLLFGCRLV